MEIDIAVVLSELLEKKSDAEKLCLVNKTGSDFFLIFGIRTVTLKLFVFRNRSNL